jgi:hypothetical protein
MMRRFCVLLVAILIGCGAIVQMQSAHGASLAKKKCTTKIKTINGKKYKVTTCVVTVKPPTRTPTATSTPSPTPTNTPLPTPSATPTAYMSPTPTQTNCLSLFECQMAVLGLMNEQRARFGIAPLAFDDVLTIGFGSCVGADGHTLAMIADDSVFHIAPGDSTTSPTKPVSFPNDVCGYGQTIATAGENVGAHGGESTELDDLRAILRDWTTDPANTPTLCASASTPSRSCVVLNAHFTRVGISIKEAPIDGIAPAYWTTVVFAP